MSGKIKHKIEIEKYLSFIKSDVKFNDRKTTSDKVESIFYIKWRWCLIGTGVEQSIVSSDDALPTKVTIDIGAMWRWKHFLVLALALSNIIIRTGSTSKGSRKPLEFVGGYFFFYFLRKEIRETVKCLINSRNNNSHGQKHTKATAIIHNMVGINAMRRNFSRVCANTKIQMRIPLQSFYLIVWWINQYGN